MFLLRGGEGDVTFLGTVQKPISVGNELPSRRGSYTPTRLLCGRCALQL
jgi:hypothetical protein